ncbi:NAD-dependent protein deacylase sirtuin-6-like [Rhopilema esculentum]|uniref:NAD-dependent protein deacylase sirtuin-6-like n=1 Tax=Rhopilema esculentum TaxID=499914 RepID=UPI0031D5ED0D
MITDKLAYHSKERQKMSVNYAAGLSDYEHKGKLDLKEETDKPDILKENLKKLIEIVKEAKHLVVHTGAGISTASGIPDFRGPKGVWTLEAKGIKPEFSTSFEDAVPSKTHMALFGLVQEGIVKHVISQNVDGLHLRSGMQRNKLSELHGNMFEEKCEKCGHSYYRDTPVPTMAQQRTGSDCSYIGKRGTRCRGKLRDTVLDWEDNLPFKEIMCAEEQCKKADVSLCLGTSLQINPSGNLPILTTKNKGKLVICNLSKTKHDKKAALVIHGYVDDIMEQLMKGLGITIPAYDPKIYLSMVSLFSKSKREHNEITSKYGVIEMGDNCIEAKRPKMEDIVVNSATLDIKLENEDSLVKS